MNYKKVSRMIWDIALEINEGYSDIIVALKDGSVLSEEEAGRLMEVKD